MMQAFGFDGLVTPKSPELLNKAKKIMDDMIENLRWGHNFTEDGVRQVYFRYQVDYWRKQDSSLSERQLTQKAKESTKERLSDGFRRELIPVMVNQINARHNDFMCEFFALMLKYKLEDNGIKSRLGKGLLDDCVVLEDGGALFPGKKWGEATSEELRCDFSAIMHLEYYKLELQLSGIIGKTFENFGFRNSRNNYGGGGFGGSTYSIREYIVNGTKYKLDLRLNYNEKQRKESYGFKIEKIPDHKHNYEGEVIFKRKGIKNFSFEYAGKVAEKLDSIIRTA